MRGPDSSNHHDIAFFTIGDQAGPSEAGARTVGMYHIAWEVRSLDELDEMRDRLAAAGALVGASDHGPNKSLYAKDPDGLEFEVMWLTPASTGATRSTKRSSSRSTSRPPSASTRSTARDGRVRPGHPPDRRRAGPGTPRRADRLR